MKHIKRVLITQNHLKDYSGSEIVTLELAEHLSESMGCEVTVFTSFCHNPIMKEFKRLKNVRVIEFDSEDAQELEACNFDLLWVHHQLLPPQMVDELFDMKNRPLVFYHHMSPYHELEFPIMHQIEALLADRVLYNSEETKNTLEEAGFIMGQHGITIGNPAPDSFFRPDHHHIKESTGLRRIAVVSNHPPTEVMDAISLMRKNNIRVDLFGREGGREIRITPAILHKYDVVMTIGKTVQYSLLSGIPVYCYDYFGGPGYLSAANFTKTKSKNFSGRGYDRKTADQILNELTSQYDSARLESLELQKSNAEQFMLSNVLGHVLASAGRRQEKNNKVEKISIESYKKFIVYRSSLFSRYQKVIIAHERKKELLLGAQRKISNLSESTHNKKGIVKRIKTFISSKIITRG